MPTISYRDPVTGEFVVLGGGGHTILEDGTPATARSGLNFIGATVTDDDVNNRTDVTIAGAAPEDANWEVVADPAVFSGIDPTGVTSSTAGLTAFIAAIPQGGTGIIPAGDYLLNTRIALQDVSAHIKAEGANFIVGSTQGALRVNGSLQAVSTITSATETTTTGYGHAAEVLPVTNLTVSGTPPTWVRGDLVKVVSDDITVDPQGNGVRTGQSMTVLGVSGSVVTVSGQVRDPFTTTRRAARWNEYPFSWTGGTFRCTDAVLAGSSPVLYIIQFNVMVEPVLKGVTITSTAGQAIQLLHNYAPRCTDITVDYAQDTGDKYGYGINDGSEYTYVTRFHARNVRHAYSTGVSGTLTDNDPVITKHGRTYGGVVENSTVIGATGSGWDTHGDADYISFINCYSQDSYGGIGLRGTNHRVLGCVMKGYHGHGITVHTASSSDYSYGSFIGGGTIIDGTNGYPIHISADGAYGLESRPTYIDGVTVLNRNTSNAIVRVDSATAWVGKINVDSGGTRTSVVNSGVVAPMPGMTPQEFGAPSPAVLYYKNNAEAGVADTTTVTNANSNGNAGTAFTTTSINGTSTFSTLRAVGSGTTSYRIVSTDGTQQNVGWAVQDTTTLEASFNFWFEAAPTVSTAIIFRIHNLPSSGTTCSLRMGLDAKLSVLQGLSTTLATYGTALTVSTWYRIWIKVVRGTTTTDGRIYVALYPVDSLVPTWSYINESCSMGTTDMSIVKFGKPHTAGTITVHLDNIIVASTPPGL